MNFMSRTAVRRKGDATGDRGPKSSRAKSGGSRKDSLRLLRIYGPGFEKSIREMDMIAVQEFGYKTSEHLKRSQIVVDFAIAHVRANPDIEEETIEMSLHVWAMAAFILCHAVMRSDTYSGASAIAARWGTQNGCSNWQINLAAEWALMHQLRRRVEPRRAEF